ncbi:amidohydrolase family protein [Nocardia acidivorans]|uniref:amidohydrolase family protein n=1 Tax=Nocardia acidivorans TaxID=404580 RepID=UPI00082CC4E0|nr:amidohydrolase family protein [Nocardia acidivorans]
MTIDIHAHVTCDLDTRLAADEAAGIDLTVLLSTRVHPERARTIDEVRAEFAVLQNVIGGASADPSVFDGPARELRAALDAHPGRVVGMAAAPLSLNEKSLLGFVDEQLRHPAMVGIGELTPAPGAAETIEPVLQLADDHGGLAVLAHGFAPHTDADLRVYADIARRYPRVPIIIGAFGGLHAMLAVDLAREVRNLHLDLSSALQAFVLAAAVREIPDKCLFGSNTPYGVPAASLATIHSVVPDPRTLRAVLHDNAATLLGR